MSADHDDYASEPIRGLPERLPQGETILWQGAPSWWQLARQVFHIRLVALYFVFLMAWRGSRHLSLEGKREALIAILSLLPITMAGLGLLCLLAWLCARTTVYTITNRRVVMRTGVALPSTINIPFGLIGSAGLRLLADGSGDIPLTLLGLHRVAYSNLWPHIRPWRFKRPEPMLRAIPEAACVANLLGEALRLALPATSRQSLVITANLDQGRNIRLHQASPAMNA